MNLIIQYGLLELVLGLGLGFINFYIAEFGAPGTTVH